VSVLWVPIRGLNVKQTHGVINVVSCAHRFYLVLIIRSRSIHNLHHYCVTGVCFVQWNFLLPKNEITTWLMFTEFEEFSMKIINRAGNDPYMHNLYLWIIIWSVFLFIIDYSFNLFLEVFLYQLWKTKGIFIWFCLPAIYFQIQNYTISLSKWPDEKKSLYIYIVTHHSFEISSFSNILIKFWYY
jgi:hypothetical protein